MWAGIEPATGVPLAMMKSYITHIMVSRKDATNYDKLEGLSQFDRLTRVEPHSSYDLPTPAWKAGVLPNKLMRRIRAPPQTFGQKALCTLAVLPLINYSLSSTSCAVLAHGAVWKCRSPCHFWHNLFSRQFRRPLRFTQHIKRLANPP